MPQFAHLRGTDSLHNVGMYGRCHAISAACQRNKGGDLHSEIPQVILREMTQIHTVHLVSSDSKEGKTRVKGNDSNLAKTDVSHSCQIV